ncbi:unnamed protein product [Ambrosiozyma monospora]|uniref:Unnamed protein product n=1 Tax=Ambrosiozyma monospora TaxID=43982 RepID=A0ACB5TQU6_AMBMO|nr:unnamed protein product [Ambrosiozyma monospora]
MEAMALVWSKKAVFATYAWIWLCFFMLAFHSSISSNLIYLAYNQFQQAPQVTTANILATIIGGVLKLPIAKLITLWGRAEGLFVFLVIFEIGIVVLGSCKGPSSYATGYVLYWIAYNALYLIMDVFIADTSGLENRAFAFAFSTTVFIITAFTGSLAATQYIKHPGWRWGYYSFAFIMPAVFLPLIIMFKFFERKAYQKGILKKTKSGRTILQSIVHYAHEFDVIGAALLMAAFVLFLLPFSLQSYGKTQYKTAKFIVMVIIGGLLFPCFWLWERYFAKTQFIKWRLLKNKTVIGACICTAAVDFSFMCWDQYFYNFNVVVYNMSTTHAGYMTQIFNVGSCFWSVIIGIWIKIVKTFKYTALFIGFPLMIIGTDFHCFWRRNVVNLLGYGCYGCW